MVNVVAALIWENDRFLIGLRPAGKARAHLWEFVGGKIEAGESEEDALIRECREELGVTVRPYSVFMRVTHEYPDLTVRLTLLNSRIASGSPYHNVHDDLRWITPAEIPLYDFCPADEEILKRILDEKEKYPFYGSMGTDDIQPLPAFSSLRNPKHAYDLLSGVWCRYTCAPRLREAWSETNRTAGQCSITAFLLQDFFGGSVRGITLPNGNVHCYNVVDGVSFDLTSEQFSSPLSYGDDPEQFREVHFRKDEQRLRYEYLRAELLKRL